MTTEDRLGWQSVTIDGIELYQRSGRFDVGTPVVPGQDTSFTKVVGFWAPRRWLSRETMDVEGLVGEIEEIVRERGFITSDGQVLSSLARAGPWEATFETVSIDTAFDIPKRRPWGAEQREFFGLEQPYQMADDRGPFSWSNLSVGIVDPYLTPSELIVGVVHGVKDSAFFTCTCHYATVVYTTRHRLVCMTCGATHIVLRDPVVRSPRQAISAREWMDLFDVKGSRHHEAVDLVIVDVQEIEEAAVIWSTDQWDEALADFVLVARSTPEEYEAAIRGTERDASIFIEAGFHPVHEPPAPAVQIMEASLDIDMMDSGGHALADGASAYTAAYVQPERLLNAVQSLFQAIELLLKARLELVNPLGLRDRPNNPMVLTRLSDAGVTVSSDEADMIFRIRHLRNGLQHSSAHFNHRATLALCRRSLIFIDRFADEELKTWAGDVISADDWYQLLGIDEIRARAVRVVDRRLAKFRSDPGATIAVCPRCSEEAMLRPAPNTGASCAICGYVSVEKHD